MILNQAWQNFLVPKLGHMSRDQRTGKEMIVCYSYIFI